MSNSAQLKFGFISRSHIPRNSMVLRLRSQLEKNNAYSGFGGRGGKHGDIFWDNESYAIKHYLKMFAELASATLKQVADWYVWLASTLGRFFDERLAYGCLIQSSPSVGIHVNRKLLRQP